MSEKTIYELSSPGREGIHYPELDVEKSDLPESLLREELDLPELSEMDVVRHFTRLSAMNYSIDRGFYPLGSCTMKYNPRINEVTCRLAGFTNTHPLQMEEGVQGNLALLYELQEWLKEITGFAGVSLQPAAGAHGELVGGLILKAYHRHQGDLKRTKILVPDSAHGTNPATSSMAGFEAVNVPSDKRGNIDLHYLQDICDNTVAGLMLTNPNTLGLFEENILQVIEIVHNAGGLVYGDGANLNALLGVVRPGDLGFDIMHLNLHKTFSTPHGGGGPGSGPVTVAKHLCEFLPEPIIGMRKAENEDSPPIYYFESPRNTIGRVKAFHGHFGVHIRAMTYIAMLGKEGMRKVAEHAVLNANYLLRLIQEAYTVPYQRKCMHEFVVEGVWQNAPDIHALDVSKRLMDYGFHPPTNYFPLIVKEALMIEPTETENKQTLDAFADALIKISQEAQKNPELLTSAPHNTPVGRLDEVKAARELVLCCWTPEEN